MNRILLMGGMMSALSLAGAAAIASDGRSHVAEDDTVQPLRESRTPRIRDTYVAPKPKSSSLQRMLKNKVRA